MKRHTLLKYLKDRDCVFLREGAKHDIYWNKQSGKTSAVPRHIEIVDILVRKICKDLGILPPR
jgi:mRNA interferase HicA